MLVPRPPLVALLLTTFVHLATVCARVDDLPARVASHFGPDGIADGYMDRHAFALVFLGFPVLLAALFGALAWGLPRLPEACVNLPRKQHWLAPERREATWRRLNGMLLWLAALTVLLFLVLFTLTVQAQQAPEQPRLPAAADAVLPVFLVGIAGIVAAGLWPFVRGRAHESGV